ncbi:MAG: TIGR03435 family protein, partial [Bryobacteraceae bacterium]
PIYALVVDNGGAKLTPHDAANSGEPWIEQGMDAPFHANWKATSSSMELLAFRLASVMDRPVIDQTGLKGDYDFKLTYTQDLPPNFSPNTMLNGQPIDTSGPTIFQAVRQQLGLRLEARRGPVQVMVIDHVEKPGEN